MGKTLIVPIEPVRGEPAFARTRRRGRPRKYDWESMEFGRWYEIRQDRGAPTFEAVYAAAWRRSTNAGCSFNVKQGAYGQLLVRFDRKR
jgi:hypothetical protein